jgi:hypothetical protein
VKTQTGFFRGDTENTKLLIDTLWASETGDSEFGLTKAVSGEDVKAFSREQRTTRESLKTQEGNELSVGLNLLLVATDSFNASNP